MGEPTCCCPQRDARECYRVRHNLDLRFLIDGDYGPDDGECQCGCHIETCGYCGDFLDSWGECMSCEAHDE